MAEETATIPALSIDVATERAKPRLVAILFCDFSNMADRGKANLLGIFNRIRVDPETKRTRPFGMFVRAAQTHGGKFDISVIDPNGAAIAEITFDADEKPPEHQDTFGYVQVIGTLELSTPVEGLYWFDVAFNGQSLGGNGLQVEYQKEKEKE